MSEDKSLRKQMRYTRISSNSRETMEDIYYVNLPYGTYTLKKKNTLYFVSNALTIDMNKIIKRVKLVL
jgi:hypothetical protein